MVLYRAVLDVPHEVVEHVSRLLSARRRELNSRLRRLCCFRQALLVPVHLRKNETLAQVAAGFGVFTVSRYVSETVDLLAERAPRLHEARKRIRLLEQENEVLRRAAAYLSQANLPSK